MEKLRSKATGRLRRLIISKPVKLCPLELVLAEHTGSEPEKPEKRSANSRTQEGALPSWPIGEGQEQKRTLSCQPISPAVSSDGDEATLLEASGSTSAPAGQIRMQSVGRTATHYGPGAGTCARINTGRFEQNMRGKQDPCISSRRIARTRESKGARRHHPRGARRPLSLAHLIKGNASIAALP